MLINHLMVTKDNDKKIKIKQDLIKESESFLILDENGAVYNKEKENLLKNGYNIKTLNFIKGEKSDNYDPFVYLQHSECPYRNLFKWISNKKIYLMEQLQIFFNFCQNFQIMKINL